MHGSCGRRERGKQRQQKMDETLARVSSADPAEPTCPLSTDPDAIQSDGIGAWGVREGRGGKGC